MSGNSLALVGDIGGTNARFALTDLCAPQVELTASRSLPNAQFASIQHAIEHYLAEVGAQPVQAALAVACPVGKDEIRLTNRAWSFSRREQQQTDGQRAHRSLPRVAEAVAPRRGRRRALMPRLRRAQAPSSG